MGNKLRLQITERYKRNVFINVVVPEGRLYEFDCILDKYENSYNDNEIFEFEETHDIDYSFINEEVKEDG